MKNVIPKYKRPLKNYFEPTVDVDYWHEAIDAFDEKDFRKAAISTINYINPALLKGVDTEKDIDITQMQGSAEINLKLTKDTFAIKAPFLKVTDKTNKIALLRKVAEVNFSPLTLPQIHLHGNELWFEYEMDISLSQPNKVYDILREVCVYADDYDNMFVENYNASFYKELKKITLSKEERESIWNHISEILQQYKDYSAFFKEKRWDDFEWDITVISLLQISNMPYIQGKLRTDIQEYISNLFNGDLDFTFRKDKGTNFIKELCAKSKEDIMKDVYHAEQFISLRWRSSEDIIKDWAKNRLEVVQNYEKDDSNFNLSYYLEFQFLKLIYDYNIEEKYLTALHSVLEEVSGLEPDEARTKLTKVFYQLLDGKINDTKHENKKGFFTNLFN